MNRRRRPRSAAALLLLALSGRSAAEEPVWHALPMPAGALAGSADSGPAAGRWRWLLDLTHRLHVGPLSSEDRDRLLASLGSADPLPGSHPGNGAGSARGTITVPLPLPPEAWRAHILPREAGDDVLRALLTVRAAGLTYRGLAQLDGPTLRAIADDARALTVVSRRLYGPFSAFARSFRVRDGRVVTPGDPEATPLWEEAVGESVRKPGEFLVKLLEKDGGRLAYLYDTIDQIDEPRRRFALGLWTDARGRAGRFRALVRVFARTSARWDGGLGRPAADASRLLWSIRVTPSGAPAPPPAVGSGRRRFATAMAPSRRTGRRQTIRSTRPPWRKRSRSSRPRSRSAASRPSSSRNGSSPTHPPEPSPTSSPPLEGFCRTGRWS
jgi:hypothetical protein